ncbi:DUF2961 domain-containing protein [Candidatus Bathyarchaeota archaeon]|nr:DUF2961 domain-containing protein [Candidatus Bathyarchaeota archaeon]
MIESHPLDFLSMSTTRTLDWKTIQVSTHGHDQVVNANFMMPKWKVFTKRGLKHRDNVRINAGKTYSFPELKGPGIITNIWLTFMPFHVTKLARYGSAWEARKLLRIQIFFDGKNKPSVDVPIGDFFGVGFGQYKEFKSKYLEMISGGYTCRFPMPFRKRARIAIKNTSRLRDCSAFYGAVTCRQLEKDLQDPPLHFHAAYREAYPTKEEIPYKVLKVDGTGFYAGMILNQQNTKRGDGFRFLEGNTKFYVDAEKNPSIEYTGTEDLFQGAWYYVHGEFSAPFSGLTVRSLPSCGIIRTFLLSRFLKNKASQYRFHEQDAIPFKKSLLVFSHHGEFDEIITNQSSVAYFYAQKSPKLDMSPLEKGDFTDEYYDGIERHAPS